MTKTTTTKKQQRHTEQCNAMIAFAETIEKPFGDLRPYPGESETIASCPECAAQGQPFGPRI
jgi:hypothetical protein